MHVSLTVWTMRTMRTLLPLFFCLFFICVINADDIRWEFDQFKSQLEGQHAGMASRLSASETKMEELVQELQKHKAALSLEIARLKNDVKKLKYQCPSEWTKFGDSCYYMSTTGGKTWQQSREFCQNQPGADLVVITSREEQDFVNSLRGGQDVWIGLTDREREGVWKWVNGTPLTAPIYWQPGQPNDRGGQDCVVLGNGAWYDWSCGDTRYWMCELVF